MKKLASVVLVMFVAFGGMAIAAPTLPLENGNFSTPGLSGWNIEYGDVTDGGGYALFQEHPTSLSSTLSQQFALPTGATMLSFDLVMSSEAGGDLDPFAWPDAFTASLLDPVTFDPLVSNPGFTEFFYLDNTGYMETVGTMSGNTISLDVSSFAGRDIFLSFDLWSGLDGMQTTARLDNVNVAGVAVVPAPAALLLGFIGTGLVGLLRRTKIMR
jgi:hypothetical protein